MYFGTCWSGLVHRKSSPWTTRLYASLCRGVLVLSSSPSLPVPKMGCAHRSLIAAHSWGAGAFASVAFRASLVVWHAASLAAAPDQPFCCCVVALHRRFKPPPARGTVAPILPPLPAALQPRHPSVMPAFLTSSRTVIARWGCGASGGARVFLWMISLFRCHLQVWHVFHSCLCLCLSWSECKALQLLKLPCLRVGPPIDCLGVDDLVA